MTTINKFELPVDIFKLEPIPLAVFRGSVSEYTFRLHRQGRFFSPPDGVKVVFMSRNRKMIQWYGINGSANKDGVTIRITPEMDDGSNLYEWFIQLTPETSYNINGQLRILNSPGVLPQVIPPPADFVRRSDFAGLAVKPNMTVGEMWDLIADFLNRLQTSPGEPVPPGSMDDIFVRRSIFDGLVPPTPATTVGEAWALIAEMIRRTQEGITNEEA